MNKLKLPDICMQILIDENISAEDIILFVIADINKEGFYSDSYLILTKDKIGLISTPVKNDRVQYFAGYEKQLLEYSKEDLTLTIIPHSDIDCFHIQRHVTNGFLYYSKDEVDTHFISFSNYLLNDMKTLESTYKKIKDNSFTELKDQKSNHDYCPTCGMLFPDKGRKVCPKCMNKSSIFIRTLKYFLPYKIRIAIMIICYIAVSMLNIVWPYLNGTILYDKILAKDKTFLSALSIPQNNFALALLIIVFTMFLTKLTNQLLGILQGYLTADIVPSVVRNIRQEVFRSLSKLSISFFQDKQTGSLMTRVINDASRVTSFFIDGLPYMFINILTVLFTCIIMFRMNYKLAIASLFLLPVLFIISFKLLPTLWGFFNRKHRATRRLNGQINDNITGARVVKAFGKEQSEVERFTSYNGKVKKTEVDIATFDNKFFLLYASVDTIAKFTVWGIGAYLVLVAQEIPFGVLMTFVGYVGQLRGPLDFFSYAFRWWSDSLNNASRIFEILDAVPEIVEEEQTIPLTNPRGAIQFNGVSFGYEVHEPVLKEISFEAEPGKMLGIVGKSGAGKSTLVNLITRLYDPQQGEITFDSIPLHKLSFQDLHQNIAIVSQETYIFIGSVAENIAYAKPSASLEEIISAAIQASAHDFITKMPDGYDTIIGSSGRNLSGGERQRISIARAILANPKVLILDEATASVDTETEQSIQQALNQLVIGRTTLSIAHRLSTLKNADKLIVIDDGKLTESGTHDELVNLQGTYFKLMELQTKALALRMVE